MNNPSSITPRGAKLARMVHWGCRVLVIGNIRSKNNPNAKYRTNTAFLGTRESGNAVVLFLSCESIFFGSGGPGREFGFGNHAPKHLGCRCQGAGLICLFETRSSRVRSLRREFFYLLPHEEMHQIMGSLLWISGFHLYCFCSGCKALVALEELGRLRPARP